MVLIATGFGAGYSPIASGTVGSLWGVALAWCINSRLGTVGQVAASVVLVLLAIPVCDVAEKYFQKKDDGRIVADEFLTFPISLIGLSPTPLVLVIAFLTNRFFDIVKPPPARGLQKLTGGIGVVIDDVFAALYSLAANHAIVWMLGKCFAH